MDQTTLITIIIIVLILKIAVITTCICRCISRKQCEREAESVYVIPINMNGAGNPEAWRRLRGIERDGYSQGSGGREGRGGVRRADVEAALEGRGEDLPPRYTVDARSVEQTGDLGVRGGKW